MVIMDSVPNCIAETNLVPWMKPYGNGEDLGPNGLQIPFLKKVMSLKVIFVSF